MKTLDSQPILEGKLLTFSDVYNVCCRFFLGRKFNRFLIKEVPPNSYFIKNFFFFFCTHGMQKILGLGLSAHHSSDNAKSLTTRPLGNSKNFYYEWMLNFIKTFSAACSKVNIFFSLFFG